MEQYNSSLLTKYLYEHKVTRFLLISGSVMRKHSAHLQVSLKKHKGNKYENNF